MFEFSVSKDIKTKYNKGGVSREGVSPNYVHTCVLKFKVAIKLTL